MFYVLINIYYFKKESKKMFTSYSFSWGWPKFISLHVKLN